MDASPSGQSRSQSCNPVSQKSVSRRERDRKICPLVQRNIAPRARPRFGLSRTHSERFDCEQREGRRILGLSDAREAAGYHYHERVDVDASQHSVDRYVQLARFAGADTSGPACFPLPRGRAIPSLELPDRFIVLHPFARGNAKSLTSEEIFEFTRSLAPHPVMIVGQSDEYFPISRNAISLVNQTDLLQLIWLLRGASFVISVDSGPMHIAAAITPDLLSIHMWTDPRLVGPYNPDAWIWKDQRIEQVRAIADEVRSKRSRGRPNLLQIAKFVHGRLLQ
jgi:heptosyltransferase I